MSARRCPRASGRPPLSHEGGQRANQRRRHSRHRHHNLLSPGVELDIRGTETSVNTRERVPDLSLDLGTRGGGTTRVLSHRRDRVRLMGHTDPDAGLDGAVAPARGDVLVVREEQRDTLPRTSELTGRFHGLIYWECDTKSQPGSPSFRWILQSWGLRLRPIRAVGASSHSAGLADAGVADQVRAALLAHVDGAEDRGRGDLRGPGRAHAASSRRLSISSARSFGWTRSRGALAPFRRTSITRSTPSAIMSYAVDRPIPRISAASATLRSRTSVSFTQSSFLLI